MILYSDSEKRKIIMDYYLNRRNRLDDFQNKQYKNVYIHSTQCVDEIYLYYNDKKNDFKFVGQGCAIFLSSTEIFIERIKELGFENLKKLSDAFNKLVEKEKLNNNEIEMLEKLNIFENVSKHLNRKECALLITKAFEKINEV